MYVCARAIHFTLRFYNVLIWIYSDVVLLVSISLHLLLYLFYWNLYIRRYLPILLCMFILWSTTSSMYCSSTTTYENVISCLSVLFVENKHRPAVSHRQIYHIMLYRVHLPWTEFEFTTLVVIGTDYIGSCKSDYHTITTRRPLELL